MSKQHAKWTFSSLGCPELDLDAIIGLACRMGLNALELRTVDNRVDLPELFNEQYGSPEKLKNHLDEAGIEVLALDTSLKLVGNSEEDRRSFLDFIPLAEALETPWLRIFDGGSFSPELSDEDREAALDTLGWWRAEKKKGGWKTDVMVETHDCLTASSALCALQDALEEPVPILWDSHHTWKKGGEAPHETWQKIRDNVVHVHIKDSISKPSARHPMTYVQLGEGEFALEETIDFLVRDGFEGYISLEWERKWHPYLDPVETALKKARQLGWW